MRDDPGKARRAVVFGGAGFVGSRVALALCAAGWRVTAVDGFLPHTGATRENLACRSDEIELLASPIEEIVDLATLIDDALVADAMGWTHHREANDNPVYDLTLNVASHLPLILALRRARPRLVCFFGSRHQYGRVLTTSIDEDTPLRASDVHGVHKIAAEMHYRLAVNAPVVSLRFGNTFGPGQPMSGDDIGLIGGFIRELLEGRPIRLFAQPRRRDCLFVDDLAQVVARLAELQHAGFSTYNVTGHNLAVGELALRIVEAVGDGTIVEEDIPPHIAAMEVGDAVLDGARLASLLGGIPRTSLETALKLTVTDAWARLCRAR